MLTPNFDNIPNELKKYRQFVNWKSVPRKEGEKPIKTPFMPSGKPARTDDPSTWLHFLTAKSAASNFDGIGFILTQDDPFVAFDFDNCRCPAFDGVAPWANSLDTVLPEIADHLRSLNTYAEVSPSGKGIMAFLRGKLPVDGKCEGPIKVYQNGCYITVTGHVLDGFPRTIEHRQVELDALFQTAFGPSGKPSGQEEKPSQHTLDGDWKERLEKAFKSKNGAEIHALYYNNKPFDNPSHENDLALCSHLAYWFDGDPVAIDAAFRDSWIHHDNWDQKQNDGRTYGQAAIEKAIASCKSFYCDRPVEPSPYEILLKRINDTSDIGILVNEVAKDVLASGLSQTEIHSLIKIIAKKTGGTIETVSKDTRSAAANNDDFGMIDHLQAAKEIVADLCRENLAYVSPLRIFRRWDERVWVELDDRTINEAVVEHLDGKTDGVTKNMIESITDLIRTRVFRQDVIWDANTGVIPVKNGELELNGCHWTLKPHVREHYRTTIIPVEYDPQAHAPRFQQFLCEIFDRDVDAVEKATLICEMIGYTLTTSCEYEKFTIFRV
jgi:hypothetical protein